MPGRALVEITGAGARSFLQGLITNDIKLLDRAEQNEPEKQDAPKTLLYACLLTPQGKFDYDFFIRKEENGYILDCEGGERAQSLIKRLGLFALRAEIEIKPIGSADIPARIIVGTGPTKPPKGAYPDPRHPDMGWRFYGDLEQNSDQDSFHQESPFNNLDDPNSFDEYDIHRICLGIPDGSRDMVVQKSTLIESGLDHLNAVSFDKGCYLGQELVARMHYRGLAKKHLVPVYIDDHADVSPNLSPGQSITDTEDRHIGEMRSRNGLYGLALIKDEAIEKHNSQGQNNLRGLKILNRQDPS